GMCGVPPTDSVERHRNQETLATAMSASIRPRAMSGARERAGAVGAAMSTAGTGAEVTAGPSGGAGVVAPTLVRRAPTAPRRKSWIARPIGGRNHLGTGRPEGLSRAADA